MKVDDKAMTAQRTVC